jgi:hypothetical protein
MSVKNVETRQCRANISIMSIRKGYVMSPPTIIPQTIRSNLPFFHESTTVTGTGRICRPRPWHWTMMGNYWPNWQYLRGSVKHSHSLHLICNLPLLLREEESVTLEANDKRDRPPSSPPFSVGIGLFYGHAHFAWARGIFNRHMILYMLISCDSQSYCREDKGVHIQRCTHIGRKTVYKCIQNSRTRLMQPLDR